MSYILEALKKSEKERQHDKGAVPDIQSIHASSSVSSDNGKRKWWPYVLAGVVLVSGVAFAMVYVSKTSDVFQKDDESETLALVQDEPAITKTIEPQIAEPVVKKLVTKNQKAKRVEPTQLPVDQAPVQQEKPKVIFSKEPLTRDGDVGNIQEQRDRERASSSEQKGRVIVEVDSVISISEIPDNIRRKIPGISFEGHVYSSVPKKRSVMINGRKMREGDAIGGTLMLKEITTSGAEFEIQGYRFRLNALQDWSFN